jgi:hypothetical protein
MPHERQHGGLRCAVLRQSRGERVPEVMQTALHPGIRPKLIPAPGYVRRMARRIAWPRLTPGKKMLVRSRFAELFREPDPVSRQNRAEFIAISS